MTAAADNSKLLTKVHNPVFIWQQEKEIAPLETVILLFYGGYFRTIIVPHPFFAGAFHFRHTECSIFDCFLFICIFRGLIETK